MTSQPFVHSSDETGIVFHPEDVDFELENESNIAEWLKQLIEQEDMSLRLLNFIFCSDDYLLRLNIQYLDHDTLTDIITFPYAELPAVEGDIFISIDRVKENAHIFNVAFEHELHRVMAHGVFHLCGYGDKSEEEVQLMRQKEDAALQQLGHEAS